MEHKWRRLFGYYKPYMGLFISDMFFAILGAGITLAIPLIVRYITGTVIYLEHDEMLQKVLRLTVLMVVLVAIECFSNFYIGYYGHMVGANIERDLRAEIFGHYQKLSFSFFDNQKVGQLLSRVTSDLFEITELLHHGPEDIAISIIKFIGSFSILLCINVKLALVLFSFIPIIVVFAYCFNRKMKNAFKENRVRMADINSQIEDSLSGIRVVKSFANEEMEIEKFQKGNQRFVDNKKLSYRYMGTYNAGLGAMITLVTVGVVAAGAVLIAYDSLSAPDLLAFILYINNCTDPIKKLVNFTEQFQNGYSGYERFLEIMSIEPDIADKPNALPLKEVRGDIAFENVTFSYEENLEKVLNHINLKVPAGSYVAIAGNSGGGKTTLCSLIPRFYDVDSGSVRIDGMDVRDIRLKDLRDNIGIVQQDVFLFAENVMENIRYGKPGATDEEVIAAAKMANAHDFIMELPKGYQTDIGQRGVKLSGGQKQRLSIARVFLKNPPILIFDEATSALDNESEKLIQKSLEQLAKGRTTFVIAHRLSTIIHAQKILVMTEKGIEEQGTHEELLAKNGAYSRLYRVAQEGL